MNDNIWYNLNQNRINNTLKTISECEYRGSSDNILNLKELAYLLNGLVRENLLLTVKIRELENSLKNESEKYNAIIKNMRG